MFRMLAACAGFLFALVASQALAQGQSWVQVEARPSEPLAVERAQSYATRLPDVSGFALPSGWFAIALGPYEEADATRQLITLRAQGLIPGDSFVSDGRGYGRRVFGSDAVAPLDTAAEPPPELVPAEETLAESRAAERLLSRTERAEVQEALQWDGFYRSTIDAAFGPGTRRAMSEWQAANGFEPTGVLSTAQRRDLVGGYRDELAALGLETVIDTRAGIEITLPTALVAFDRYEAPFVHFEPREPGGPTVLLISQNGDRDTLWGLYDIMQTLEIVPLEGPRQRGRSDFTLTGANDDIVSTTEARLTGGAVKGFTLVWPADGDMRRRERVLDAMLASFTPTGGVLPDTAAPVGAEQRRDLLAGLSVRQPERTRTGFFVDGRGHVLTSADAVDGCARLTVNDDVEATLIARDDDLGVALISGDGPLAPVGYASFRATSPRLDSEVSVAGFPYGGALGLPTLTYGTLSDVRGLNGENGVKRLAMLAEAGDAGGPVFDTSGAVLGALLPPRDNGAQVLPEDVRFAADATAILDFLSANGVTARTDTRSGAIAPEDLSGLAADMTVLVRCWN